MTTGSVAGLGEGAYSYSELKKEEKKAYVAFGKGKVRVLMSVQTGKFPDFYALGTLAKIAYSRMR